ncbi:MAG: glycosyltransferase, partial [Candidatus Dadabacteria bacterium]|nr:glycosyltransferase [Candidatus Dadabacteria bacterium]
MKLFWVFNGIVIYIRECVKVIFSDMRLAFKDSFQYPRVTVVVPVLNEEKFLENCLQSIRSQTYQNWECIVVDDGSTDKSPEIAKNFEKIDSRIRCVFHEVNFGLAAARNTGVKHAKGQLITFLDADDFLFSSSLWQRVFPLVKVDQKKHAGCFCGIVAGHQWKGFGSFYSLRFRFQKREVIDFISAKGECPFNAHAPLIWTSIIRDFGGFKESMVHGAEDWELWFRILRHGYKFIPSYGYGGVYRQKPNSMIRKSPGIHVHEAMRLIEKSYEKYVPDEVSPG